MLMDAVESYLEIRRAMGFSLRGTDQMLKQFARYAASRGDEHVRTQTAVEWASRSKTPEQSHYLLRRVVIFARHARAEDPLHEVPPEGLFPNSPRQFTPHVYEPEEIAAILTEAGRLGPPDSLRPYVFIALFSLLFATGLRISEALALRFEDITNDGLIVRKTKFRKTRLVPLHDTAQKGIERFLARRRTTGTMSEHIFIDLDGMPLRYRAVRTAFDQIRIRAGLARPPGHPQPRIHDTRHTFAVRALETSPDGRHRIGEHMLALATYLGHGRIADTYWYLQATPRLMLDIADACGTLFEGGNP